MEQHLCRMSENGINVQEKTYLQDGQGFVKRLFVSF